MKKYTTLFIFLTLHLLTHAQGGIWTWVNGIDTFISNGNIGIMGVPDSTNYPPGRYQAGQWTDLNGNLWIFGGDFRNDLWKYDPLTNIWTWVNGTLAFYTPGVYGTKGVPAPNNMPGGRQFGMQTWTDEQGRLWLHGEYGVDHLGVDYFLDDLWMYDIPSNQWTWMAGFDTVATSANYGTKLVAAANNTQGPRAECNTAWVRSDGTFWTYGGEDINGVCNDVWMYDINTNMWTWMSGNQGSIYSYNYGTLNVELASNLPPPRESYSHWQDANDNFYIYGGHDLNDVWRYNTTNNLWTWIWGDSIPVNDTASIYNPGGVYIGTCSTGNGRTPNALWENRTAQMKGSDVFWEFGGWDDLGNFHNDLWNFNLRSSQWTWVSGDSTTNSPGSYGVIGVSSMTNLPPSRNGFCMWVDNIGTIWLWGGRGNGSPPEGTYSDMWKFVPDTSCIPVSSNNGINSIDETLGIRIYPNPATQICSVYISDYNGEDFTARLTDMTGKEMSTWSFEGSSYTFSVSGYTSGVYLLQINDTNGAGTVRKLVVE